MIVYIYLFFHVCLIGWLVKREHEMSNSIIAIRHELLTQKQWNHNNFKRMSEDPSISRGDPNLFGNDHETGTRWIQPVEEKIFIKIDSYPSKWLRVLTENDLPKPTKT